MSKGIAIRTILLMLIGLLVVVIVSYLVYKASGNPALSDTECRARFTQICTMCMNSGWNESVDLEEMNLYESVIVPCSKNAGLFYWSDNRCCGESCCGPGTCGGMKWDCETLLGEKHEK